MRFRTATSTIFILIDFLLFVYPRLSSSAAVSILEPQRRSQPGSSRGTASVSRRPRVDYSRFSHHTLKHRQDCASCHKFPSSNWKEVRKGDEAFPDVTEYPQHSSCISCHCEQFFKGARPLICANCHVNVAPRNGTRYPFPSLGEAFLLTKRAQNFISDFLINFPHDKHVEIVGQVRPTSETGGDFRFISAAFRQESAAAQGDKSCSVCHQTFQPQGKSDDEYVTKPPANLGDAFWLKKGTFKTLPLTHATCFTCHSEDSGVAPAPNDCNTCHKLSTPGVNTPTDFDPKLAAVEGITDNLTLMKWRRRESSATFRHEGGIHPDVSCTACHHIATMNTLDAKTLKVPVLSCGGCHVTQTADEGGALNFEVEQRKANSGFQCVKCHINFGKAPVPASHLNAIATAQTK